MIHFVMSGCFIEDLIMTNSCANATNFNAKASNSIAKMINLIAKRTNSVAKTRGIPIIGSATISATDMVFFTNIGIGTEQQVDRYCYHYLYSSNSLHITDYALVFYVIHVALAYCYSSSSI